MQIDLAGQIARASVQSRVGGQRYKFLTVGLDTYARSEDARFVAAGDVLDVGGLGGGVLSRVYVLTNPKDWLVKVEPYISWVAMLLKAFVPLAGTVVTHGSGTDAPAGLSSELALMNDVAKALPTGKLEIGKSEAFDGKLRIRPKIEALRHIHDALLAQVSTGKRCGDLNLSATKSGELLWLCRTYAEIQQPSPQNLSA